MRNHFLRAKGVAASGGGGGGGGASCTDISTDNITNSNFIVEGADNTYSNRVSSVGYVNPTSGNIYIFQRGEASGKGWGMTTSKFNNAGTFQWGKTFDSVDANKEDYAWAGVEDSSGNFYIVGVSETSSGYYPSIIKVNSSGTPQWGNYHGSATTTGNTSKFTDVCIQTESSTEYIYAVGQQEDSGTAKTFIAKFETDGDLVWSKWITSTDHTYLRCWDIETDGTNIYLYAEHSSNGGIMGITKIDSSGSITWTKVFSSTSSYTPKAYGDNTARTEFHAPELRFKIDRCGKMYAVLRSEGNSNVLLVVNSDGTLDWSKQFKASTTSLPCYGISVGVTENSKHIVVGEAGMNWGDDGDPGGSYDISVYVFDEDGDIEWISVYGSNTAERIQAIFGDAADHIYFFGRGKCGSSNWRSICIKHKINASNQFTAGGYGASSSTWNVVNISSSPTYISNTWSIATAATSKTATASNSSMTNTSFTTQSGSFTTSYTTSI